MKLLWRILRTFFPLRNNPWVGLLLALPMLGADLRSITPGFGDMMGKNLTEAVTCPTENIRMEAVLATAQTPPQFSLLNYWPGYAWSPLPSNTLSFPYRGGSFPAFVLLTNAVPQDISGGAITATFRVVASPDAAFTFGGEGRWNTGNMPTHARLFFSSYHGYLNESGCPECFWFSGDGWVRITNGVFTITATLDPSRWTHGYGQTNAIAFHAALTNCIEVGVCFGGGSFFDIGVGLTNGTATFEMLALDFLPPASNGLSLTLTNEGVNCVETSTDLISWAPYATRVGTNVLWIPVGTEPYRFWKAVGL